MAYTFNAEQFFIDFDIEYTDNHHHCTKNNINIHCPFCNGSRNFHMGFHKFNGYIHCWRCGGHSVAKVVQKLTRLPWGELKDVLKEYQTRTILTPEQRANRRKFVRPEMTKLPGIQELLPAHAKILKLRGFNVEKLVDLWGLQSTGISGDYKFRIYIPIMLDNEPVSYTTRATNMKQSPRYMTCDPSDEKVHHKRIVYGLDYAITDTVVLCEGPSDVWRMGPGAVATFGTSYTIDQLLLLSKFRKIYMMYDMEDPNTKKKTEEFAVEMSGIAHTEVIRIQYPSGDPGSLRQDVADDIMDQVFGRNIRSNIWE